MTDSGARQNETLSALSRLLDLIADEPVPEKLDLAWAGLSDDAKKVLALLQSYESPAASLEIVDSGEAKFETDTRNEAPSPWKSGEDLAGEAEATLQRDDSPLAGDVAPSPAPFDEIRLLVTEHGNPQAEAAPADSSMQGAGGKPDDSSSHDSTTAAIESPQPSSASQGSVSSHPAPFRPEQPSATVVERTVHLPNARQDEPYRAGIGIEGFRNAELLNDSGSGLVLDSENAVLVGIPRISGDFRIFLWGLVHGTQTIVRANLAVIPDPKSLWVNVPSDQSTEFWKPDEDSELIDDDLLCVAASKRGRSHARDGSCRDDDFAIAVTDDGWYIAAVADGAGSARYSRQGSKIAVQTVLDMLPSRLEEQLTPSLANLVEASQGGSLQPDKIRLALYNSLLATAFQASIAVAKEAEEHGKNASDFSTTLIICVARRIENAWFFAGFSIGDGGAAVLDLDSGSVEALTIADSGEFAGQTRFLHASEFSDSSEAMARLTFTVRENFTALVITTRSPTNAATLPVSRSCRARVSPYGSDLPARSRATLAASRTPSPWGTSRP